MRELYRYTFHETPMEEVEASLVLAIMATESLHGEVETRLETSHLLDVTNRCCVVDGGNDVGRDLNRLFLGFLRREFGANAFKVERVRRDETANAGSEEQS